MTDNKSWCVVKNQDFYMQDGIGTKWRVSNKCIESNIDYIILSTE